MKLERLLGITTSLLNHRTISAHQLADRYEVSIRTIQRDIATLAAAGIPVVSLVGQNGGYRIADGYTLSRQLASPGEFRLLSLALAGIGTAWSNDAIPQVQAKLESLQLATSPLSSATPVTLDFSAYRESPAIDRHLDALDAAIQSRRSIVFSYATDGHPPRRRSVEPLALQLKWHAWYLFAWCQHRQGYRLFKLARIEGDIRQEGPFTRDHGDVATLLRQQEQTDLRPTVTVSIRFRSAIHTAVREYLGVTVMERVAGPHPEGVRTMGTGDGEDRGKSDTPVSDADEWLEGTFTLPEGERGWMSFLIGFGGDVRVLGPQWVVERASAIARRFLDGQTP